MGAPKPTGWFRTESGVVLEMDIPLLDGIAHRVKTGDIVQVANAAGDPLPDPDHPVVPASEVDDLREQLQDAVDDNELLTKQLQASEADRDKLAEELQKALERNAELETRLAELEEAAAADGAAADPLPAEEPPAAEPVPPAKKASAKKAAA